MLYNYIAKQNVVCDLIWNVCCRNLLQIDKDHLANPYVRIYIQTNHSNATKKKTAVVKNSLNPRFDETWVAIYYICCPFNHVYDIVWWYHQWRHVFRNRNLSFICMMISPDDITSDGKSLETATINQAMHSK